MIVPIATRRGDRGLGHCRGLGLTRLPPWRCNSSLRDWNCLRLGRRLVIEADCLMVSVDWPVNGTVGDPAGPENGAVGNMLPGGEAIGAVTRPAPGVAP